MGDKLYNEADDRQAAIVYITTILVYVFSEPVVALITDSKFIFLATKMALVGGLLIYWRKWFYFKLKFDFMSVIFGLLIALIWIAIDPYYQHFSEDNVHVYSSIEIILKLMLGVIVAPLVEEFFTRFFLHRFLQEPDWLNAALGKFSWNAFIWTAIFFGFSHGRWLAGLIAGIAFNLLWYWKKDMNSVVTAHAVANLMLAIAVLAFGMWQFW